MTRKDYILIAKALKAATPLAWDGEKAMTAWNNTVLMVATALAKDNPKFDKARFVKAARGE